ncbi:TPA: hypothetical protein NKU94_000667 [Vibrio parahaemolyticus]|nr:hypothetical protein [Vibrio parahaemolyticus]
MKSIINQLNNYTSNLTIEDICSLSDYDYVDFLQQYRKLVYITAMRLYWLTTAKRKRSYSNIKQFKKYHHAQQLFYQQVTEEFHLRTGINPSKAYGITELYEAMLERHSRFHIAKSIYADDLLTAIQYAVAIPDYGKDLSKSWRLSVSLLKMYRSYLQRCTMLMKRLIKKQLTEWRKDFEIFTNIR